MSTQISAPPTSRRRKVIHLNGSYSSSSSSPSPSPRPHLLSAMSIGQQEQRQRRPHRRSLTALVATSSSLSLIILASISIPSTTHHLQALAADPTTHHGPATTTPKQPHEHAQKQQQQPQQQQTLNYLLYSSSVLQRKPKTMDQNSLETLLKDTNHSHASDRVDLSLANDVWRRMQENALNFAQDSTHQARPTINRLLNESRVSLQCKQSINDLLDHLASLDEWALEMYNSFGNFPAIGLFEGSHTSMGSYHQCVNVAHNDLIGRPQYCTFKFQPVIPKRPRYHNILATIDNLANFTKKSDMFHGLAKKAHYFYYTKLILATCMPSKCEKADLDLIGEQIAVNTYLQFQGTQCLEKEVGFNPDSAQVFALAVLLAMASVSLLGTLVHLFNVRSFFESSARPVKRSPLSSVPIELTTAATLKDAHYENNNNHNNNNISININNNNKNDIHPVPQKGAPILPTSVHPTASDISVGSSSARSSTANRIIHVLDILMHFSIIKNGRKLFDTSTSRRAGNSRAGSLVPGMREAANGASDSSTGASSRSDSSSVDDGQSNDISCVHGLRFWTISWIILGHTMQYTEWAGFGRAYQVEHNITSFFLHPLLNATFSVDTFFLVSGLLTTYVTWTITRGHYWRFNKFAFLISRYLRLMPQVLIVILIFIVFPMLGDGPYWRGIVQKESDNCKQNWWVSALFLQSFYRQDKICNLVTWWLSIEMFYHFTSIIVIIALLHSARKGIAAALLVGGGLTAVSCYLHYVNHYPPNMLPTLLQRYEIWDSIVLKYFWTPYPHAPSYFVGLLLGYALYNRSIHQLSRRQVRLGWVAFSVCYLSILFGTYHWNNNAPYSRFASTAYYNLSQIFWSLATGWAILACALGSGGWLNDFLSSPVFIPLGRATYMTYLSHMLIVMSYPAKMNLLIEPSYTVFLYIFISNLFLSYALGICLTLVYESPILHLQKLLVARMASRFNEEKAPTGSKKRKGPSSDDEKAVRVSLYTHQHAPTTVDTTTTTTTTLTAAAS